MLPDIWTRCGAGDNARRLSGVAWRVVEAQHLTSTRKLVDSSREQELLEELIETAKPPVPKAARDAKLHYLLFTPFRYPPLRHGSRFGTRQEPSIWYGSRHKRTAMAETAYYRLLFQEGTEVDLGTVTTEMSAFQASYRTGRGVDLSRAPFDRYYDAIASRDSYDATKPLGRAMRNDRIELFRFPSARDPRPGVNVGIFHPKALSRTLASGPENWHVVATRFYVEFIRKDFLRETASVRFEAETVLP